MDLGGEEIVRNGIHRTQQCSSSALAEIQALLVGVPGVQVEVVAVVIVLRSRRAVIEVGTRSHHCYDDEI